MPQNQTVQFCLVRNGGSLESLEQTLQSLLNQTYKNFHLVLFDSTKVNGNFAPCWTNKNIEKLLQSFSRFCYDIGVESTMGDWRKCVVKASGNDLLCFIPLGITLSPNYLETMINQMQEMQSMPQAK